MHRASQRVIAALLIATILAIFAPSIVRADTLVGPVSGNTYYYTADDGSSHGFRENNGVVEFQDPTGKWLAEDKVPLPFKTPQVTAGFAKVNDSIKSRQAQTNTKTAPKITLDSPLKDEITSLKTLITTSIPEFLIMFIGFVSLIMFFLGAVRYLWAGSTAMGGNDGKQVISDAKSAMVGSIIGLVISLLAYGILATLKRLIGA